VSDTPVTVLALTDVSTTYRARPALRQISWTWQSGQQWACLGANGAGKTTLARVLSGQLRHAGECWPGTEMAAAGIAYVCFESQQLLCARERKLDQSEFRADAQDPGTTVRDAILGPAQQDLPEHFQDLVGLLRLEHVLERGLRFISTGEMRKTLLLRAIMGKPGLLILDNPLDGLDLASQDALRTLLDSLLQGALPVLLLCREPADIPLRCSHVMVLDGGRCVTQGQRDTVLTDPRVQTLLNPPAPALTRPPTGPLLRSAQTTPVLRLQQVNVHYGNTHVLRDVDWSLKPGEHCCIAGPNGCGKSTLLSLLTGTNHKAYGQDITLFGLQRGSGESVWDIRRHFGVLDTNLQLGFPPGLSALEVVVSGFFDTAGLYDDASDMQRRAAMAWLTALGLGNCERLRFDTLSFGVQRLVLVARAVVKQPDILVLDEPCLGLDGPHRQRMLSVIDHIAAHTPTQVLYVSHSAGTLPACINRLTEFVWDGTGYRVATRAYGEAAVAVMG